MPRGRSKSMARSHRISPGWLEIHHHAVRQEKMASVDVVSHEDHGGLLPLAQMSSKSSCMLEARPWASSAAKGSSMRRYPRRMDEDAGDLHPLLHPARELGGVAVLHLGETHQRQHLAGPSACAPLRLCRAFLRPKQDVGEDASFQGKSVWCWNTIPLSHARARDLVAVDQDPAARGEDEAGDSPEERRFSAALKGRGGRHRTPRAEDGEIDPAEGLGALLPHAEVHRRHPRSPIQRGTGGVKRHDDALARRCQGMK